MPVAQLRVGMHVVNANGGLGTITRLKIVPGAMTMYNLEVAQDHTYAVGNGHWIVHNCSIPMSSVNSGVRMTLFYRLQTDPPQRNGQELTHPLGQDGPAPLVLSPFTTRSFMRKLLPLMVITSA